MSKTPIPTHCFALVVVRWNDRFLLVHERKHGQKWFLPAGRVEKGETFQQAARRETLEESSVMVRLTGILSIEHTPSVHGSRFRVLFVGEPINPEGIKTEPDHHTLEARWVSLDELAKYELRSQEVVKHFQSVAAGAEVYPLDILQSKQDR